MSHANPPSNRRFRFGTFELDPRTGELRRNGFRLALPDQPLQVLIALLEQPGELVTREELQRRLWHGETFVDFEHGLNAAVRRLRDVLGDSAETPRFVETVPRRGYRFIAPVSGSEQDDLAPLKATETATASKPRRLRFPAWRELRTAGIGILRVASLAITSASGDGRGSLPASHKRIQAVVVLPVKNLTGNPSQGHLADGATATVAAALSQGASLMVLSTTTADRYRTTSRSAREIAADLDVDGVIEGALLQSGNRLRVTIALVQAKSERRVWTITCERQASELLDLYADITLAVADAIRGR
jgi:DNA-binding winged helix-turn-helix (wHTH) protein/TolB-like protein